MSNEQEQEGLNVDEFYDEGVAEAGVEPEQDDTETEAETEQVASEQEIVDSALKATESEPEQKVGEPEDTESSIAQLLEGPERKPDDTAKGDGKNVPLDQHIKLRQRAQAAEAKVKELEESQTTPPAGEKAETKGELPSVVDEDGYVDPDKVAKAIADAQEKAKTAAVKEVQAQVQQQAAVAKAQQVAKRSIESEADVRKTNPDYDKVTKAALQYNLLTNDDRQKIFDSDNPAKTYYETAKQKLSILQEALGISTAKPKTQPGEPEPDKEIESDEQMVDEVFGEGEAA